MLLDHLRPAMALVTLCLIFVQGRAHQAQQLPSAPPVAQASRAATAPVLDGRILDDPAWQGVPALVDFKSVQCESCHGKGTLHGTEGMVTRVTKESCITCHDATNDPDFDFEKAMAAGMHHK